MASYLSVHLFVGEKERGERKKKRERASEVGGREGGRGGRERE